MRIDRVVDAETLGRGAELFDSPPVPEFVSRFLASPGHHLLYAWDDSDRAIGFVSGVELTHPDKGTEMYMEELGVVKCAHRHGVATSLVEALLAVAKDAGCNGMWGVPNPTISKHSRPTDALVPLAKTQAWSSLGNFE